MPHEYNDYMLLSWPHCVTIVVNMQDSVFQQIPSLSCFFFFFYDINVKFNNKSVNIRELFETILLVKLSLYRQSLRILLPPLNLF